MRAFQVHVLRATRLVFILSKLSHHQRKAKCDNTENDKEYLIVADVSFLIELFIFDGLSAIPIPYYAFFEAAECTAAWLCGIIIKDEGFWYCGICISDVLPYKRFYAWQHRSLEGLCYPVAVGCRW